MLPDCSCYAEDPYHADMDMTSSVPPVSKEQAFLETYFLSLSKFAYDKAKDLTVSCYIRTDKMR